MAIVVACLVAPAPARAGQIDPAYGTNGVAWYDPAAPTLDVANAMDYSDLDTVVLAGAAGDHFGVAISSANGFEARRTVDFGVPSAAYAVSRLPQRLLVAGAAGPDFGVAYFDSRLDLRVDLAGQGRVRTPFGAEAVARALVVDGEAAPFAAGYVRSGQGTSVALARYDSHLVLNPSFGAGGKVIDDVTPGDDAAYAAIAVPGGILVAGRAGASMLLALYGYDGRLDPTFGAGGHVVADLSPGDDIANAVWLDATPYLRAPGVFVAGAAGSKAFVARYLLTGVPDESFGDHGVVLTDLGRTSARFTTVAPFPNTRSLLLAGTVEGPGGQDAVAAVMLDTGALDPSFGAGGVQVADLGGAADVVGSGVTADPASYYEPPDALRVSIAGGNGADMAVATFDNRRVVGVNAVGFGEAIDEVPAAFQRMTDGRVVLSVNRVGASADGVYAHRDRESPFLVRLLPSGAPDPTFGRGGRVDLPVGPWVEVGSIDVQPDGAVLVVTYDNDTPGGKHYLSRYLSGGVLDPSFGTGGTVTSPIGVGFTGPARTLSDGRILVSVAGYGMVKLTASGQRDTRVGQDGYLFVRATTIVPEPGGSALLVGWGGVSRVAADGTVTQLSPGLPGIGIRDAVRLSDGRVAVVGLADSSLMPWRGGPGGPTGDVMAGVLFADGRPDPTFGDGGVVRLATPDRQGDPHIAMGPAGTLTIAAASSVPSRGLQTTLFRLLPSGRPDRSFHAGGWAVLAQGATLTANSVLADGQVLLSVGGRGPGGTDLDIGISRFRPAGMPIVAGRAWGWNATGQLGNWSTIDSRRAVGTVGLTNVKQFSGGWYHSVALLDDGSVWTWGWNGVGQLGLGATERGDRAGPTRVTGLPPVIAVAAGAFHTLAIDRDGRLWAWGWNALGQLGTGTYTDQFAPVPVPLTGVRSVSAGLAHTLAVRDDATVWSWGWNANGQLGDGTNADHSYPAPVLFHDPVDSVAAGALHSALLGLDGRVRTWGWNGVGQLGYGAAGDAWTPHDVPGLDDVQRIATGAHHTLALKTDGSVRAWGWNATGQLGDGTTTDRWSPIAVAGLAGAEAVAGGILHSAALLPDGRVLSWGWNGVGQLGDGTAVDRYTPVLSTTVVDATTVAAGGHHTLVG